MSRGKKLFLMSFLTLIALIAVGQFHHNADPTGTKTGSVSDYLAATGQEQGRTLAVRYQRAGERSRAPAGLDQLHVAPAHRLPRALHAGRLRVPRHRADPREERRPHDDDEPVVVRDRADRVLRGGVRLPVRGDQPRRGDGQHRWHVAAEFDLRPRQRRRDRPPRLLPAVGQQLRRRRAGVLPVPSRVHGDRRATSSSARSPSASASPASSSPRSRWARSSTRSTATGCGAAGWLSQLGNSMGLGHGAVDFAGSGVVHATGGWAALALAMLLGPRIGKYRSDGTPRAFPGHNLGYVVIGTLVLTFGWMGFNPGSTFGATDLRIAVVAVNTLLAASAGAIMAMAWTNWKWGKPDISMTCNGMLAGLVAITAPCAFVAPWASSVIGIIAGALVCWSVEFFDKKAKVDDPCGAISVHGMCGAWGLLAVGLFADGTYGFGWNGVDGRGEGHLLRRLRRWSVARPSHRPRRRLHLGVGHHVPDLHRRQALHRSSGSRRRSRSRASTRVSSGRSATRTSSSRRDRLAASPTSSTSPVESSRSLT